jgi:hypothetical protein
MLTHAPNFKLNCEWNEAIKLNYKDTATHVIVDLKVPKHYRLADYDVTLLTAHSKPFKAANVRRHDTTLKDKCW